MTFQPQCFTGSIRIALVHRKMQEDNLQGHLQLSLHVQDLAITGKPGPESHSSLSSGVFILLGFLSYLGFRYGAFCPWGFFLSGNTNDSHRSLSLNTGIMLIPQGDRAVSTFACPAPPVLDGTSLPSQQGQPSGSGSCSSLSATQAGSNPGAAPVCLTMPGSRWGWDKSLSAVPVCVAETSKSGVGGTNQGPSETRVHGQIHVPFSWTF